MDQSVTSKRAAAQRQPGDPDRHYLIYCDESGLHGTRLTGFGSLWLTYERRGDFQQIWRDLHDRYFPPSEVKWEKVKRETQPFFEALVDEFFRRKWLMFHCLLISKQEVNLSFHNNDWDLARRKHFTLFLANKIRRFATPRKHYMIRVDPIHSSYAKADEAAGVILSHIMEQAPTLKGTSTIDSLLTVDSKETPGVQLADLLVGAVLAARHGHITADQSKHWCNESRDILVGRTSQPTRCPVLRSSTSGASGIRRRGSRDPRLPGGSPRRPEFRIEPCLLV